MSQETWLTWGVPAVVLVFGAMSLLIGWIGARDFDRRYGRGGE